MPKFIPSWCKRSRRRRLFVEALERRDAPAADFRIVSLSGSNAAVVDHTALTFDDSGGIAVSDTQLFVTGTGALPGQNGTARFNKTNLTGGTTIAGPNYDSLVSDLRTEKVYLLGSGPATPIGLGGGTVTHLIEINGATGVLTGTTIALSASVTMSGLPFAQAGIFAGYGRVLLHSFDGNVMEVAIPSGTVSNLGALTTPAHNNSFASWAYWGVAEHFGGQDYITYVRDSFTVARRRISNGAETPVATFGNLGDMASITVSLTTNRWYFHNEGNSQFFPSFFGTEEISGFADGTFEYYDLLVTNLNDAGAGSLRQAILDSNTMPGIQTIGFDSALNGNIDINSGIGDITLTDSATILGPGTSIITVNGGNAGNRIFVDGSGGTLTLNIRGLTLNNLNGFVFPYTLNATGDLAISAGVGDVAFTKTLNVAAGMLTLTDGNTVDLGATTTVGGTLAAANGFTVGNAETLTGAGQVNGNVFVAGGGTLAGNLNLTGNVAVQNGGNLAPGVSPGTVTINGNLVVLNGGTLTMELNGPSAGQYDKLVVNGLVDIGTHTNFVGTLGYSALPGDSFTLIDNNLADPIAGLLNGARDRSGIIIGAKRFHLRYGGGTGNDLVLITNSAPVLNTAVDTSLSPILEDVPPSSNPGTTIDALLATGGLYSDPEGIPRSGVAVTGLNSGSGSWQYSMNGGGSWTNFVSIAPSFATLLEADGAGMNRIRFTPNGDFFGTATMSFTGWDVSNGRPDGSTGINAVTTDPNSAYSLQTESATILVLAVNDNPVAGNDSYAVDEDVTLNVIVSDGVLDNDSDVDGPFPLTASLISGPAHGDLTLNPDGSFTYEPDDDFNGADSFTYKVRDGDAAFNVGIATINVTPLNDDPFAQDDSASLPEDGGAAPIAVLGNDTALPDGGESLVITSVTQGQHGTVGIGGGGLFVTYLPDADDNGPDSFTYTLSDGSGGSDTATVDVTVTSVNDDPDANNDTATVDEDGNAQAIDVLANDSFAPDTGETLKVTSVSQGLHGTVVIAPGGGGLTYEPNGEYSGPDTFLYTIDDGNGGSDVASVTVNVVNDAADRLEVVTTSGPTTFKEVLPPLLPAPVVVDAGILVGTGLEGVITSATVKIASGYVKKKDKLMFTTLGAIKGSFNVGTGTLTLKGTASQDLYETALQSVVYVNASPAPVDGTRVIAFQVKDAAGTGEIATKLLRVEGVNTKPILTLTGPPLTYKNRGKPLSAATTLKLTDVDNDRMQGAIIMLAGFQLGDELLVTAKPKTGISAVYLNGVLTLTGNATKAAYLAALKSLKFKTLPATPAGVRTISITVFDGDKTSDQVQRTLTVV